jgi:indolepyruvate ferredoxin oxidoreductase, alpha subunit
VNAALQIHAATRSAAPAGRAPMYTAGMTGCEAAARGAFEAGAHTLVSYPGSPVTGIVEAARTYPSLSTCWAANEKVALEIGAGIAYSGASALVVMKHVGLNVAADPLFNLAYTGVRGALVLLVGDDPGASCSQNEQDTRLIAAAANVPVLEPSDVSEIVLYTKLAFAISRRFDLPVIVRLTTQLCYATQAVVLGGGVAPATGNGFAAPVQKYLLLPSHVPARHRALLAAVQAFRDSAANRFFYQEHWPDAQPAGAYPVGLICAGHTYAQVREHFEGRLPILQVGCSFPLNEAVVNAFAARCEQLVVTEECSNLLRNSVMALGHAVVSLGEDVVVGEFDLNRLRHARLPQLSQWLDAVSPLRLTNQPPHAVPAEAQPRDPAADATPTLTPVPRPPGFCAGCSHVAVFDVLRRMGKYVVGDIGCYTLGGMPAFGALHSNLCMGASVGVLQGYLSVEPERRSEVVAVIGDSTFFHSGIPSVITAVSNHQRGTLLVLDNSGTAMTGFQRTGPNLDARGWNRLLAGLGVAHHCVVSAFDVDGIERQIAASESGDGFSVIVLKGLCVQGRPRKGSTNFRYSIAESACTHCGVCKERTDCPAIVAGRGPGETTVFSIANTCVGCGVCAQTCAEGAVVPMLIKTGIGTVDRALGRLGWPKAIRFIQHNQKLHRIAATLERETP